jgi:hypothetical protein
VADVLILFIAALAVLAGAFAVALVIRSGRRRRALAEADRPRRAEREIAGIDDYLRRLSQAAAGEEIDRLESERKRKQWDGLSSRSSSGSPP